MRTLVAFVLRLVLLMPVVLAAAFADGFSAFFEQLACGLRRAERHLHQITTAPYLKAWKRDMASLDDKARHEALRKMLGWLE